MNSLTYKFNDQNNNVVFRVETNDIQQLLLQIGFPQHVYGYNYTLYALELILLDPDMLNHMTKELYPEIAKHFNSTPVDVLRAIRIATYFTWLHGNYKTINTIFGSVIKGLPTNTQLLAGLYYHIKNNTEQTI